MKNYINVILSALFILIFSFWCFFVKTPEFSESERRQLAKFPEVNLENISSGQFAGDFESYTTDRFPLRDMWRTIKAYTRYYVFMQDENNGIYYKNGHISKQEYPMNKNMMDHAIDRFNNVKEMYIKEDNKVYFAMIPDKNKYLAELKMDYDAFEKYMHENLTFMTPIKVGDLLSEDDYYFTDSHWRQNKIVDVAEKIATSMGTNISGEYKENVLDKEFFGVWSGQSALNVKPDTITYLTNDTIDNYKVTGANAVYDMLKAESRDPYEFFLSGNQPVITIENSKNTSGKTLIIFRDSFGSSISPLLAEGYSKTVLVDLRYIHPSYIGNFVDFTNADVLFLYSTVLLNSSLGIK